MAVLESEVDALKTSLKEMGGDVREIRDAVLGAKGGWKAILVIGGAGATLGALFIKLLPLLAKILG